MWRARSGGASTSAAGTRTAGADGVAAGAGDAVTDARGERAPARRRIRSISASCVTAEKRWLARSSPSIASLAYRRDAAVLGRDARGRELAGERGAAHEERDVDAGHAQVLRRDHHLLGRLHQQAGEPDGVGLVVAIRGDELFGRHLDPEVDHPVAVVGEDDLDQVLADVVHVALHGGQHDRAARGRPRPSP